MKEEIFNYVVGRILRGEIGVNERVPTEMALAKQFKTTRMNAHYAVKMLERQGIVRRNKGEGTIVIRRPSSGLSLHLANAFAKRVQVIASLSKAAGIHWNRGTISQLEQVLNDREMAMIRHSLSAQPSRRELHEHLREGADVGCCALVLLPEEQDTEFFVEHLDLLYQYYSEVVLLDRGASPLESWPFHSIGFDPFGEGSLVAEHLYEVGYRRIVFWRAARSARPWAIERERGVRLGLQRASGAKLQPDVWVLPAEEVPREIERAREASEQPLAVVAINDKHATTLIDACRTQGTCAAGRDFALVGFDKDPRYADYQLTTVAPPIETIGQRIGELVSSQKFPKNEGDRVRIRAASSLSAGSTCPPAAVLREQHQPQPGTAGV